MISWPCEPRSPGHATVEGTASVFAGSMSRMGLNLDLKRGENTRAVSVNGSWVHQTRNGASERSGFVGTGDPNEMAIAWTTELLAKGWLFDELGLSDVKPGELTAVSRQLPCPSKNCVAADGGGRGLPNVIKTSARQ